MIMWIAILVAFVLLNVLIVACFKNAIGDESDMDDVI